MSWPRRWTDQDVARANGRLKEAIAAPLAIVPSTPPRPRKYHNHKVQWQGEWFDSGRELKHYRDFLLQRTAGAIRAVIRQVSMVLPHSHRRIRIDFLVIENDGAHRWYDSKGFMTPAWSAKRDQVLSAYGIDIKLI